MYTYVVKSWVLVCIEVTITHGRWRYGVQYGKVRTTEKFPYSKHVYTKTIYIMNPLYR